jgi:hypothetical protein
LPSFSFRKAIFTHFLGLCLIAAIPKATKAQTDSVKTIPVEKLPIKIRSPANIRHVLVLPIVARSIETGWSFGLASASTFHLYKRDTAIRTETAESGLTEGQTSDSCANRGNFQRKTYSRTSNAQAIALYTTRKQFVAALNGSIYFPGERWIINEQFSYSSFPDDFWGLGRRAPDTNKESYKFKQYYIYLHPQFQIGRNLFLGTVYEFQRVFAVA